MLLPYRELYTALDACKVADYVVFVLSPDTEVDSWGELALRCLQAQGLPEVVSVMAVGSSRQSLLGIVLMLVARQPKENIDPKERPLILKSLLSFMQFFAPTQSRIHDLGVRSNALNAARSLCEGKPSDVRWREGRSWMLAEDVQWDAPESVDEVTPVRER